MKIILIMAFSLCLSACVSLQHERCLEAHREYAGYEVKVFPWAKGGLYRCGEEWYVGALRWAVVVRTDHLVPLTQLDSRKVVIFSLKDKQGDFCCHKISAAMANRLREGGGWISPHEFKTALHQAGGSWERELPRGAQYVPASYSEPLVVSEIVEDHSPWYAYPAAGLTLLCVDVPLTALLAVPSSLLCATMWACSQSDVRAMKADMKDIQLLPLQNN